MTANALLQVFTQGLFVLVFLSVVVQAIRRPLRATVDTALLFGAVSLVIAVPMVANLLNVAPDRWLTVVISSLLMSMPYLMMRLVDDFSDVPRWVMRTSEFGLALSLFALVILPLPVPAAPALTMIGYFVAFQIYAAAAFIREATRSNGVTRRRMHAVAAGSLCLGLVLVAAGLATVLPGLSHLWTPMSQMFGLVSGIAYFLGFSPPRFLRRAWQEPELRAFLGRAANLPRLPETSMIVTELEAGAAASIGAPAAVIGIWDDEQGVIRYRYRDTVVETAPTDLIAGWAFSQQRPVFSANAERDDREHAKMYQEEGVRAILAAPIVAGQKRLGVLAVWANRAPVFAEDDLELVQLLADQAAVILESRALIDEASRVRAREEATRLKDDFLSAAAHDLKTPLTTLVAQAQLLERRAKKDPQAPPDLPGIQRIVREAKRLNTLVLELLDVSRLEQGLLVGLRETLDLAAIVREACERHASDACRCIVDAPEPVVGEFDRNRIHQLLLNLIENANKYSPAGGDVRTRVWQDGDTVHLTVTDQGIGIPPNDLSNIFERFQRGANVDDRQFAGMGLGLYICRGIVEQHGGKIWASSPGLGRGTTIHVSLPTRSKALVA